MSSNSPPWELHHRAIIEDSDDAIISKDLTGVVQTWNAAAQRIFGFTAEEMIGQSITRIIPPARLHEEPEILKKISSGQRIDHFETMRQCKDGTLIDISVTISPIRSADGTIVGISKIARDITAMKRAAREVERVNRMKDEFLATLSHELRTPLNAIVGWCQLMQQAVGKHDFDTLQEGVDVIQRNARAQTQLIEDLLDMSRIVSGRIRLDVQQVNFAQVIQATIESVKPAARSKNISIHKILDPNAGPIAADPNRLQQVIWNLLTNAIKFTPKKGCVSVVLQRANSHIELTVSDNGEGIEAEFLPYVFDRFRQADSTITRRHGGLGLGLAIVKQLVELHGGTVSARSAGKGRGTAFTVSIPIAVAREPTDSLMSADSARVPFGGNSLSLAGIRILVVEDESDARELIRRILSNHRAQVFVAPNAQDALGVIEQEKPDLIISDIGMPQKDGYEFIRDVRRLPPERGGRIPAIALTALARSEDRTRAMMAGYQIHLAKPVEGAELLATVASVTGRTYEP